MKKYDVALALASTKILKNLGLARMLIDMLDLDDLDEPLRGTTFEDLKKLTDEECFNLLEINYEEKVRKFEDVGLEDLKNYDVALALATAGNIEQARKVMEFINPKKSLDISDFEILGKLDMTLEEAVNSIMRKKEKLDG